MAHLVQQSATSVDAYTQLAFIFFLETALPFISLFTNNVVNDPNIDCYDSCGLYVLVVFANYYYPALILYGFPFLFMGIYSLFGVGGGIVKWQITIGTRYLGLLYRVWGVLIGIYFVLV